MKKVPFIARVLLGLLGLALLFPASAIAPAGQAASRGLAGAPAPAPPRLAADLGRMPLQFVPNGGRLDERVAFTVEGRDKTVFFTADGLTIALADPGRGPGRRWTVKLDFVDPNRRAQPVGLEASGTKFSYFQGDPGEWRTGLAARSKIVYRDLWPGIDLAYSGTSERLKYEFVVRPGADPDRIRLAYRGAESVALTADGRLEVRTPAGGFSDDVPVAFQDTPDGRAGVPVAYALDGHVYGFEVGHYDRTLPLVLDPSVLIYCGYIGGAGEESGRAIAVDSQGYAYVAGIASSSEASFPVTVGPDLTYGSSNGAGFVAKLSPDGTTLVYCGYITGASCTAIAVDEAGCAYVTGEARDPGSGFPAAVGPDLTYGGSNDAYIAKVAASGESLVYCGYIGGAGVDLGYGVAVDGAGQAYVVGLTNSNETTMPIAAGPDLTYNGRQDAFCAKVAASGGSFLYCGYIGSSGDDVAYGIAMDPSGYAYIVGQTYAIFDQYGAPVPPLFPVSTGPGLTYGGNGDAFVAKVDAAGAALVYCGYLGGASYDRAYGVAVDGSGCAFVTGHTQSPEATFPVETGPDLTFGGYEDAFVAKVEADGSGLAYCGYIGGEAADLGYDIAVDASGSAYVTGETWSDETTFPTVNGPDRNLNGSPDAFVAKVAPSGAAFAYCGYVGGESSDYGYGIAVDAAGCAYITGSTTSHAPPMGSFPFEAGPGSTWQYPFPDVFAAKLPAAPEIITPVIDSLTPSSATTNEPPFTQTVRGSGFDEYATVQWGYDNCTTTFVSETELQAEIPSYFLAHGNVIPVKVHNPGGEVSNIVDFHLNNPVPVLDQVDPDYLTGGSTEEIGIFLWGSGFVENSVVRWNGQDIHTGLTIYGEGWAMVPESALAVPGAAAVTVFNPEPVGGTSAAHAVTVTGFTLSPSPQGAAVNAGQSATYQVTVAPLHGPFDAPVILSCSGLPRNCSAVFQPATPTPGADPATTTLTVHTQAPQRSSAAASTSGLAAPLGGEGAGLLVAVLALAALGGLGYVRLRSRWLRAGAAAILLVLLAGCGTGPSDNSSGTGTPKGTYNIGVKGTSGTLSVTTEVVLTVR